MFLALGVGSMLGWVFSGVAVSEGVGAEVVYGHKVHALISYPQRQSMHLIHTHINREDSPLLILTPRTKG